MISVDSSSADGVQPAAGIRSDREHTLADRAPPGQKRLARDEGLGLVGRFEMLVLRGALRRVAPQGDKIPPQGDKRGVPRRSSSP